MRQLDVQDASSKLSELIERVRAGDEVVITLDGKPVARIVPAEQPEKRSLIGLFKGQIEIADDFDAPLPDEVLREWGLL